MLRIVSALFVVGVVIYARITVANLAGNLAGDFQTATDAIGATGGFNGGPPKDDRPDPEAPEVGQNIDAYRTLAILARNVAPPVMKPGHAPKFAPARGQALIWDVASNLPSKAHYYLPTDVRALDPAAAVTVYLIQEQKREFIGAYSLQTGTFSFQTTGKADAKGYRIDSHIAAVAMPTRIHLGTFLVTGKDPGSSVWIPKGEKEVEGEWWTAVREWVEPGVRGPEWRNAAEKAERRKHNPPTPKGLEALETVAEAAKAGIPAAKQLPNAAKVKLPGGIIIWNLVPELRMDNLSPAYEQLPNNRKAGVGDDTAVVMFVTATESKMWLEGAKGMMRREHTVCVVAMPGAQPIGTYRVQGTAYERRGGDKPNDEAELARWAAAFGTKN